VGAVNLRQSGQLQASEKHPNVVLEIEGLDQILSVTDVYEIQTWGSGVPVLVGSQFGSKVLRGNVRKILSLDGTTQTISQSVEPDKGTGQSTTNITVRIVDVLQFATRLISPSVVLNDILYRKAVFYVGLEELVYPQDYNRVFSGVITSIKSTPSYIDLTISHPDEIKRTEIFKKAEAKLTAAVDYFSGVFGSLTLTQRSDFVGTVSFELQNSGGSGGSISVSGGAITVTGVVGTTTWGRVKELIEGSVEASQLVSVVASGPRADSVVVVPLTVLSSSSEIVMDTVDGFLLPVSPLFTTYVKIDDELINYTGINTVDKKLTGITRAQLNSIGKTHKVGQDVSSFYVLGDSTSASNAIELMKYILLSGGPEWYAEDVSVSDIVSLPTGLSGPNALFFRSQYLRDSLGVSAGDTIELSDCINAGNDVTALVQQVFEYDNGTFIQVDDSVSLVAETASTGKARLKSGYNILPDGAGVVPSQIDVPQLELIQSRFSSGIAEYTVYLKDTVKVKEFLEKEILFPSGLYSVARKGRISIQYTAPAIFDGNTAPLDRDSVVNPQNTVIERGTGKFFYNSVVYKYDEDSITDRFLRGTVSVSGESIARIPAPTKAINIFARGLRDSEETTALIDRNTFRLLSRYKYGSESLDVSVAFRVGSNLEIGDAVQFGDLSFPLPDTSTGLKKFAPRTFEIVNKELNWRRGEVRLRLVDTAFLGRRRFGLFSPSSRCDTGSSTSRLVLRQFYNPDPTRKEVLKWASYLGRQIRVRSTSKFTTSTNEIVTIVGFDAINDGSLFVAPVLTFVPTADSIIEIPPYSGAGVTEQLVAGYKSRYVYWTPQAVLVSQVSTTVLDVGADSALFFPGCIVRVHSEDFTRDSGQQGVIVQSIAGSQITLRDPVPAGFLANDLLDLIGFVSDGGDPYAWL